MHKLNKEKEITPKAKSYKEKLKIFLKNRTCRVLGKQITTSRYVCFLLFWSLLSDEIPEKSR